MNIIKAWLRAHLCDNCKPPQEPNPYPEEIVEFKPCSVEYVKKKVVLVSIAIVSFTYSLAALIGLVEPDVQTAIIISLIGLLLMR